ncbi:hypothetical protein JCM10908_004547 [Rhodotorula pacifica]|uniref:uncharacterized protein n=1 Tax=Rhodotorula pacifica TaxID=1495444 RepID=UPI00317BCFF2
MEAWSKLRNDAQRHMYAGRAEEESRRDATLSAVLGQLVSPRRAPQEIMTAIQPSNQTYGFPFKPYKQQEDLMAHLYRAMAAGQVTVIESPTGTMFPYLPPDRFSTFSCGHVVPSEQVLTCAVGKGPSGMPLSFTYSTRKDEKLVFWEPKSSGDVDAVLRDYAAGNVGEKSVCLQALPLRTSAFNADHSYAQGSVLFAVIGAKLSEGINFADDMARCVVVCGA